MSPNSDTTVFTENEFADLVFSRFVPFARVGTPAGFDNFVSPEIRVDDVHDGGQRSVGWWGGGKTVAVFYGKVDHVRQPCVHRHAFPCGEHFDPPFQPQGDAQRNNLDPIVPLLRHRVSSTSLGIRSRSCRRLRLGRS